MRPKTFVYILLGLVFFFGLFWLFNANHDLLFQRFIVWEQRTIPLYGALALAFTFGLLLALTFSLARESRHFMERWREQRSRREASAVDDLYAQGMEALVDGSPSLALEKLREVLAREPRRVDALLKAGEILRGQDRGEEAAELHLRAHQAAPHDPRPLWELVSDAESRHDLSGARRHLDQLLSIKPRSLAALRRLRDLYMREESWKQALEVQERVEKARPKGSPDAARDARTLLGLRYQNAVDGADKGRQREAINQLRRLLKENPTFVPAWKKLGELRLALEDPEAAVVSWQEGYQATRSPVLLSTLEDHFLEREQPERAIEAFRHAVGTVTNDTVPRFYLGKLYYRLEMLDEALAELTALQDRASYAPTLAFTLARLHERRARHAEANEFYRQIVREQELLSSQFRCLECGRRSDAWREHCPSCRQWNTYEVDFKEDVTLEELGISSAPVYTAPGA